MDLAQRPVVLGHQAKHCQQVERGDPTLCSALVRLIWGAVSSSGLLSMRHEPAAQSSGTGHKDDSGLGHLSFKERLRELEKTQRDLTHMHEYFGSST